MIIVEDSRLEECPRGARAEDTQTTPSTHQSMLTMSPSWEPHSDAHVL